MSEKSAANMAIPGCESLGRMRTGFREGLPGRFGRKTGLGPSDGRSSGPKKEIPANVLRGTIRLSSYLASTYRYFVTVGAHDLMVDQNTGRPLAPGTPVHLVLPPEECWIFNDAPST